MDPGAAGNPAPRSSGGHLNEQLTRLTLNATPLGENAAQHFSTWRHENPMA